MKVKLIGIDLAKNVFQLCALSPAGKVLFNRKVKRHQLLDQLRNIEPTVVAMESCASAHYWGRTIEVLGHQVMLVPPQHCKPFVRGGKSDARDALAICEAALRPNLHSVPIKTTEQQDLQLLHRIRERHIHNQTALANQIRGIAREYGVEFPVGIKLLCKQLPEALEDADNGLTPVARELLSELHGELLAVKEKSKQLLARIVQLAELHPAFEPLQQLPGVGPLIASVTIASMGNGHQFRNGRQVAAWLGLVPRQHGTGGKMNLMGITKNGDRHLRTFLIHGARSAIRWSRGKDSPLGRWITPMIDRRGYNKATVALANKLARISWAVLSSGTPFDERKAFGTA